MKLEWTEGCTCYGLDVDEENFWDLSDEQKIEVRNRLCDWYKERELPDDNLFDFIVWITSRYGDCEFLSHCETCGDDIYITTLEI